MIRLANYTTKLGFLIRMNCHEESYKEFVRVCKNILGICLDDLFSDDCNRLAEMVPSPVAAIRMCRLHGYDLSAKNNDVVPSWQAFAILILAKAEGLIPSATTLRRERKLAIRADDLLRARSMHA